MTDEDMLNYGKAYMAQAKYKKALKIFINGDLFLKGSENDELRKVFLAMSYYNLKNYSDTIAVAKTIKSQSKECKETAAIFQSASYFALDRFAEGFAIMKTYLKTSTPYLYLQTINVLLEMVKTGEMEDEKMIADLKVYAIKYKPGLEAKAKSMKLKRN